MTTLYEAGKMECEKLQPLRIPEATKDLKSSVEDYFKNRKHIDKVYLLLCIENKDFTAFIIPNEMDDDGIERVSNCLLECMLNRGQLYGTAVTPDRAAIELWINYDEDEKPHCYFFFPFDQGVIDCRGGIQA